MTRSKSPTGSSPGTRSAPMAFVTFDGTIGAACFYEGGSTTIGYETRRNARSGIGYAFVLAVPTLALASISAGAPASAISVAGVSICGNRS